MPSTMDPDCNTGPLISTRLLNITLIAALMLGLVALTLRLWSPPIPWLSHSVQDILQVSSLVLLAVVISLWHLNQVWSYRQAASQEQQIRAMVSMFTIVKHELNNDMQVVIGNAELASLLIPVEDKAGKSVNQIREAATFALDRIQQLSTFSASAKVTPSAVDLNAMLREAMARLSNEIPSIVILRLELDHLPMRVMVDRNLMSMSLCYLVRQAVKTLHHGGEIVIRSRDVSNLPMAGGIDVQAEIFMVRALSHPGQVEGHGNDMEKQAHFTRILEDAQDTTSVLVKRSGAVMVGQRLAGNESLIKMGLVNCESTADERVDSIKPRQSGYLQQAPMIRPG